MHNTNTPSDMDSTTHKITAKSPTRCSVWVCSRHCPRHVSTCNVSSCHCLTMLACRRVCNHRMSGAAAEQITHIHSFVFVLKKTACTCAHVCAAKQALARHIHCVLGLAAARAVPLQPTLTHKFQLTHLHRGMCCGDVTHKNTHIHTYTHAHTPQAGPQYPTEGLTAACGLSNGRLAR